jgi:hypothetical protein
MAASLRDLEHATQLQFVRAQKAEQKAEGIQHALNLMLNLGFERFHRAMTTDGAVHEFQVGTVRNLPTPDESDWPATPKRTNRDRRIILWRTMFPGTHQYASAFHDAEFRSLPKHLESGSELRILSKRRLRRSRSAGHGWSSVGLFGIANGLGYLWNAIGPTAGDLNLPKWEFETHE